MIELVNGLADPQPNIAVIILISAVGGFVNATSGGGGLITIPALILMGLNPIQAIATDKVQAVVGMATSTLNFRQQGLLSLKRFEWVLLAALIGGVVGATLLQFIKPHWLYRALPWMILILASYLILVSPNNESSKPQLSHGQYACSAGLGLGIYDGCFGPATASFYAMSINMLLGKDLKHATAYAKAANLASSFGAAFLFVMNGTAILWIALLLCIGQIIGAWIGSALVVSQDVRFIRFCLLGITVVMAARLFWHVV